VALLLKVKNEGKKTKQQSNSKSTVFPSPETALLHASVILKLVISLTDRLE
jgi:hypothetical protein